MLPLSSVKDSALNNTSVFFLASIIIARVGPMWNSQPEINNNKKKLRNSNSSPSSNSNIILPLTPRRSMEEVWKDINLSSSSSASTNTAGIILQDFLAAAAGPLNREAPLPLHHHHHPPPPNIIDLNLDSCCHLDPINSTPTPLFGFCINGSDDDDRRHKRMIKNRESAARSRARKQAYTNELELEVAHLVQENSRLRRQYEQLKTAMIAQNPTKKILQRSSSAPI